MPSYFTVSLRSFCLCLLVVMVIAAAINSLEKSNERKMWSAIFAEDRVGALINDIEHEEYMAEVYERISAHFKK